MIKLLGALDNTSLYVLWLKKSGFDDSFTFLAKRGGRMKVTFKSSDGDVPFEQILEKIRKQTLRNATVEFHYSGNYVQYTVKGEVDDNLAIPMLDLKKLPQ